METKFNFNSAICTSRSQSERLLTLGLKKETADCGHFYERDEYDEDYYWETRCIGEGWESHWEVTDEDIPAWSVLRLFEMYTGGRYCKWDMSAFKWDDLIDCIEDAIKRGYFNKNYLL